MIATTSTPIHQTGHHNNTQIGLECVLSGAQTHDIDIRFPHLLLECQGLAELLDERLAAGVGGCARGMDVGGAGGHVEEESSFISVGTITIRT